MGHIPPYVRRPRSSSTRPFSPTGRCCRPRSSSRSPPRSKAFSRRGRRRRAGGAVQPVARDRISLYPYAVILQVTPIVAIAPLLLVYLPQPAAVLACAWIVAFFPVLANTTLGLRSVDRNLADLFRLYGATRWQVLRELKLPAALPYILGGLKIAGGLSLIGAVVAEIAAGSAAPARASPMSSSRPATGSTSRACSRRCCCSRSRGSSSSSRSRSSPTCCCGAGTRAPSSGGVSPAPAAPARLASGAVRHAG